MKTKYKLSLEKVLTGQSQAAAADVFKQRDEWQQSTNESIERQLIAVRLALKSGNLQQIPLESLDEKRTSDHYLKAEILFVKATYHAQSAEHQLAAICYLQSSEHYRLSLHHDREALARFNHFIANTYAAKSEPLIEERNLDEIIKLCREHNLASTEFLCHRHKSFRHFEAQEYHAAIDSLIAWIGRQEAISKSDSELAILHIADCCFELGDLRKAIFYFDQIPGSIDERVRFPKALVEAKIFRQKIDIESFPLVTSHWRERYLKSGFVPVARISEKGPKIARDILMWNLKTGILSKSRSLQGKIKAQSLEGQLLRLLMDEPRSKSQICESLWPLEMETAFLDDRFHQLIQRVNRKLKDLILFDGHLYKLSRSMKTQC
jgi:tetratricopeptide (TPR) repeat protein